MSPDFDVGDLIALPIQSLHGVTSCKSIQLLVKFDCLSVCLSVCLSIYFTSAIRIPDKQVELRRSRFRKSIIVNPAIKLNKESFSISM